VDTLAGTRQIGFRMKDVVWDAALVYPPGARVGTTGETDGRAGSQNKGPTGAGLTVSVFLQIDENPNCDALDGNGVPAAHPPRAISHLRYERNGRATWAT